MEPDLALAAYATSKSYGLVAAHIVNLHYSELSITDARIIGESLGNAVYAIDAIRDFPADRDRSYNPLCLQSDLDEVVLPEWLRAKCVGFIGQQIDTVNKRVKSINSAFGARWAAVAATFARLCGMHRHDSVLQACCVIPCGDGAVGADSDDCGTCVGCMCGCTCCLACCMNGCCFH